MVVGWRVHRLREDCVDIRRANKTMAGERYWFFRYMPPDVRVEVVGIPAPLEANRWSRLGLHNLWQCVPVLASMRRFDVILSHHMGSGFLLAGVRRLLGRATPPHVIIDVGLPQFVDPSRGARRRLARYILGCTDAIVYHARVQEGFYRTLGLPSVRHAFIPFGIDPQEFPPLEDTPPGDYIISAGDGARDYDTLVQASTQLSIPTQAVSQRYRPARGGLPDHVTFRGYTPISELKRMIAASRLVVLPLQNVPVSCGHSVLLQSMAMGKAVVVSRVPGVADYVVDGETAVLCEPGDAQDLADKVSALLRHPERARRIGESARQALLRDYTEERMAQRIHAVLEDVVARRKRGEAMKARRTE